MCGIAGYIGKNDIKAELLSLIKCVEYRGYDSSGIAYLDSNQIKLIKSVGDISKLKNKLGNPKTFTYGIAHTRWATHGKANETNAHPHISQDNNWALVHNGIIENYLQLKQQLQKYNFHFVSQTDTEAIAHLLQANDCKNPIETIKKTCDKLKGSYALAIISKKHPNKIFTAKKDSPLYIAHSRFGSFVASDPICFVNKATTYFTLNDGEFAEVSQGKITFFDNNLNIIKKSPTKLNLQIEDSSLDNFNHFMQKEISQVPSVIKRIIKTYKESQVFEKLKLKNISKIKNIILIGCGTAYHASLMGANFLEKYARIRSQAFIASEFRYGNRVLESDTIAIFVSQSGETADTIKAMDLVKKKGIKCIALTNVLYSTLAQNCDYILPVCAGPELAVASTKAYTAQISILYLFAKYLQSIKSNSPFDAYKKLQTLITNKNDYQEQIKSIIPHLLSANNVFFIGRDTDFITVTEASLKLKEITYINSSAYPSGELKHGFLALIDNGSIVFVLATDPKLLDKTLNGAHEAYARGAKIIVVSNLEINRDKLDDIFINIKLTNLDTEIMPIASIEFFQWLSYYTSISKNINPDKPRNLAKSVTVE